MGTDFQSEVRQKLIDMNVTLTPCKFCNEDVIFLMINKTNPALQKNWIIPFGLDLEPHRDKCRARANRDDNRGGFGG